MSGMDVRGHLREGSIARKRGGIPSSTVPTPLSSQRSTPPLPSPSKSYGQSTRDQITAGAGTREFGFLVKVTVIAISLLSLGYYGTGYLSERSVRIGGRERKSRLNGGEGWILPRKWRDYDAGHPDSQIAMGEVLPTCKRVLLHVFDQ